ncbi:MAG: sugar phosphate isomerase/epimerase [Thaumarchaeota archaeon]|nr:sugar phosphate isomerase/epimerase [Nitrososphaerota archaeon]
MKLGVSTWSLLREDVVAAVKAIGDAGFDYIELWGEIPHAYPDWTDKKKLQDSLSTYDFTVTMHAPFTDLNLATPYDPVKGAVEKALGDFVRFSSELGASLVTVHPGSVHNEAMVPESVDNAVSMINSLVKVADGTLSICVENQARGRSKYHLPLGCTNDSLEALLSQTEGTKFTLDTGHAHASELDPLYLCDKYRSRLAEIHLSDNAGESDDHLIPGKGSADLKAILGRVTDPDVLICLELDPHRYDADEVIRASLAFKNSV